MLNFTSFLLHMIPDSQISTPLSMTAGLAYTVRLEGSFFLGGALTCLCSLDLSVPASGIDKCRVFSAISCACPLTAKLLDGWWWESGGAGLPDFGLLDFPLPDNFTGEVCRSLLGCFWTTCEGGGPSCVSFNVVPSVVAKLSLTSDGCTAVCCSSCPPSCSFCLAASSSTSSLLAEGIWSSSTSGWV